MLNRFGNAILLMAAAAAVVVSIVVVGILSPVPDDSPARPSREPGARLPDHFAAMWSRLAGQCYDQWMRGPISSVPACHDRITIDERHAYAGSRLDVRDRVRAEQARWLDVDFRSPVDSAADIDRAVEAADRLRWVHEWAEAQYLGLAGPD